MRQLPRVIEPRVMVTSRGQDMPFLTAPRRLANAHDVRRRDTQIADRRGGIPSHIINGHSGPVSQAKGGSRFGWCVSLGLGLLHCCVRWGCVQPG